MAIIEYIQFGAHEAMLLVSTLLLLVCSATASASEVAFFSLTPNELRALRHKESFAAEAVLKLLAIPDRLLATILVMNNLVNIAIVIVTSMAIDSIFDFGNATIEFLFTGVFVTFLLLLFGEIMPKVLAQGANMRIAQLLAPIMLFIEKPLYPLSYLLIRTGGRLGEFASHTNNDISIEELADAVDMTTAPESEEQKILAGIVGITSREVENIMRPRMDIRAVEQTMLFSEVKQTIIESGYSRLPVYDEDLDHIRGTIFVKDLLPYIAEGDDFGWQRLIREPYFVPMHKKVSSMLEDFQSDKIHMAIVVDEYGATQGLVSLEDILEEVVGEISDESDNDESFYRRLNENTYLFDGKTHIVDMTRVLDLDDDLFEDVQGRAETIAGLMLEINRNFLKKDDEVKAHNVRFIVNSMDGRRIESIKVILRHND